MRRGWRREKSSVRRLFGSLVSALELKRHKAKRKEQQEPEEVKVKERDDSIERILCKAEEMSRPQVASPNRLVRVIFTEKGLVGKSGLYPLFDMQDVRKVQNKLPWKGKFSKIRVQHNFFIAVGLSRIFVQHPTEYTPVRCRQVQAQWHPVDFFS